MKNINKYSLFFLCLFFLNFNFSFSEENFKFKEDIEIEKIKQEINLLQDKIKKLEKRKILKSDNLTVNNNLKIGLTLSGGGAKGYAHLGVLKILEKEKIKIDYISGTSIGALIGTLYSAGYSIENIEKILDKLNIKSFLETGQDVSNLSIEEKESLRNYGFFINYDNNLNFSLPKGIRSNEYMYLELKKILKDLAFKDLTIPVTIIATNLSNGQAEGFKSGDLAKVLTASMALPTLIEPVQINDTFYIDGLVSKNLPVEDAYNMGADIVIASDIGKQIQDKKNYNIFSVINQIIEFQSANSTMQERSKATILIQPDIQDISAINTSKKKELIVLGENAATDNLTLLSKLPKSNNKILRNKIKDREFFIEKINYSKDFKTNTIKILDDIFSEFTNKKIKESEIQEKINSVANLKYLKNINYSILNNTLQINGEDNYQNKLGLNYNYKSKYGSTLTLGTNVYFRNVVGSNIYASAKVGDYLGLKFSSNSYYGSTKKVGVFASLGYDETPFYIYKNIKNNKNIKTAKYTNRELALDLGLYTEPTIHTYLAYGLNSKLVDLKLDTGNDKEKELEYSKNINKTYIRMKYDSLDSLSFPMSGIKADFIYTFSSSFRKNNTNLYGPSYTIKGYKPINKKLSLIYGLNSAVLKGKNIKANQYIKLGGIGNNIESNEFEFYGFNFQEKSVEEFLSLSLGLRYHPIYSLYLSTKLNATTFNESSLDKTSRNKMRHNYAKGIIFSVGYASPLGPIEFSISSDLKEKKPIAAISIGYTLD